MAKLIIEGGRPLKGQITVRGAKNAALLAIQMLALSDPALTEKLNEDRVRQAQKIKETQI